MNHYPEAAVYSEDLQDAQRFQWLCEHGVRPANPEDGEQRYEWTMDNGSIVLLGRTFREAVDEAMIRFRPIRIT